MMNGFARIMQKMMGRPSCEEINRFLAEYVEGTMQDDLRVKFDKHISRCKCCGGYLEDYRSTIDLVKTSQDVAIPDRLADYTVDFLRKNLNDA
jgi:hypothetical protein